MARLGDLIADSTLDVSQLFEQLHLALLCKDGIQWGFTSLEDIPSFFTREVRVEMSYPPPLI